MNFVILYLDPGTGSLILQIVLGSILASLLFIKSFWLKFISVFRKKKA